MVAFYYRTSQAHCSTIRHYWSEGERREEHIFHQKQRNTGKGSSRHVSLCQATHLMQKLMQAATK